MEGLVQVSDESLLFDIIQGDKRAFGKFYGKYKSNLLIQAKRKVHNNVDAEEIFVNFFSLFITKLLKDREVFIKNIFKYHQDSALPYMMIMIRNLAIDFHRSNNKKQQREQPLFSSANEAEENSAQFVTLHDQHGEEESKTLELYHDVIKLIWEPVRILEQTLQDEEHLSEFSQKQLEREINKLSKDSQLLQDIFELLYMDGYNCTEVSHILKIDPKTLRSKREKLRDLLSGYMK